MIRESPALTPRERSAVEHLLECLLAESGVPILGLVLFGSKARGDADAASDVDVLVICGVDPELREPAAEAVYDIAEAAERRTGVRVEAWAVAEADLERGARTPMLVDALEDGVPLWPPELPPLRVPFTPEDARFCVRCLLEWVEEGGDAVRLALREGQADEAAGRARDDITRLATAALLTAGRTRHRRRSSLRHFEDCFVRPRLVSPRVLPALAWAGAAYPDDGGRGTEDPPVPTAAAATAELGYRLAGVMQAEVVPLLLARIERL